MAIKAMRMKSENVFNFMICLILLPPIKSIQIRTRIIINFYPDKI
jgi:hypothetical protein